MTRPLTSSIEIAKAPESLWILLTTVGEIADWYDNWDAVENCDPGEFLRVGSTFRLIHRSRDESAWCRVQVADAPHRLRWIEVASGRAAVAVEFYLEPDESGGTVLTHTKTVIGPEFRLATFRNGAAMRLDDPVPVVRQSLPSLRLALQAQLALTRANAGRGVDHLIDVMRADIWPLPSDRIHN